MICFEIEVGSGPVGELEIPCRTIFHVSEGTGDLARHGRRIAENGTLTGDADAFVLVELVALAPIDLGPPDGNSGFELSGITIPPTNTTGEDAPDQGTNPDNRPIRPTLTVGVNEFDQFRHFLLSHGILCFEVSY